MAGKDVKMTGQSLGVEATMDDLASLRPAAPVLPTWQGNERGPICQNSSLTLPSAELSFYP